MTNHRTRKKQFRQNLSTDSRIKSLNRVTGCSAQNAWRVETQKSTKILWVTYSKFAGDPTLSESPFYGSTWDSIHDMRGDHPLYLVFLGATEEDIWIIPFADFVSRFDISASDDDAKWKFNFDHGNNREILPEYLGIELLFEY